MSTTADTQLTIGASLDGSFDTTIQTGKRKMGELGTAAREAGKGTNSIGDGMASSATKVEAATKNMVGSIQRQIAALEAGDKSSRQYQESLARMRGIDTAALKPYLDQLDAAKLKQKELQTANVSFAQSFSGVITAVTAAAAAFGAFGIAVKKIVDGVDALNDLKDATGASIENISALEDVALRTGASFDTVQTSLIKLNQALNTAKPGSSTEAAIKAIGLSVTDLKSLDPAEAFRKIAVSLSGFADDSNKARLTQELFGKSLKEVAPLLKDLAEKGQLNATVTSQQADEAERFNKELAAMSKNMLDVARNLSGPVVSAFNEWQAKLREGRANGQSYYTIMVNEQMRLLGMNPGQKEYAERIAEISVKLKDGNLHLSQRNALLREQQSLQGKMLPESDASYEAKEMARFSRKPSVVIADKADTSAAKKAIADANKELEKQSGILQELSGYSKDYEETIHRYAAMLKSGAMNQDAFNAAVNKYVAEQKGATAAAKAEVAALEAISKARNSALLTHAKELESLDGKAQKLKN